MNYTYRFPVVKGIQAGRDYYIGMVPLKMISKLFPDDDEFVSPEHRAQRKLNINRIPDISKYILDNRNAYVFSALAASIDGEFRFEPIEEYSELGVLQVDMDARFLINDGQHRKAAILEALQEDPTLGNETISMVFFEDKGLSRSQQIFTDLNKHAVKTSNSISELYDSRDELAVITRRVVSSIDFLRRYTDLETDNLGKFSSKLFSLNTFYKANKKIIQRGEIGVETEKFLISYWSKVTENITPWNELINKQISKVDLRENYIITQSVVIQALGRLGKYFYLNPKENFDDYVMFLKDMDWSRIADQWYLRAIKANGRMISSEQAMILIGNTIKQSMGIPLDKSESIKEMKFISNTIKA